MAAVTSCENALYDYYNTSLEYELNIYLFIYLLIMRWLDGFNGLKPQPRTQKKKKRKKKEERFIQYLNSSIN